LLQPIPADGGSYRPPAFTSDLKTVFATVNRDGEDEFAISDWFTICGLDRLTSSGINYVGLFIDNSGNMNTSTVQGSSDEFIRDLTAAGLTYSTLENGEEDWISPFLVDLV
jgi:hypothetical protein